jgi:ABC-type antimicrobial peptide transport system permease subunit
LGVEPLSGRTFTDSEGQFGGPLVVLLSEPLWRQNFHSDPGIVGQVVKISGQPRTVVGIMPESFHFPEEVGSDLAKGVWIPLQPTPEMLKDRGYNFFNVVGRLRPGVTLAQMTALSRKPKSNSAASISLKRQTRRPLRRWRRRFQARVLVAWKFVP